MKKFLPMFLLFLLFLFPVIVFAQLTVVSTQPLNNAKNVPLITTISITFSEAIDTVDLKNRGEETTFTNIDSVTSNGFSGDGKTMFANVVLKANQSYFLSFIFMKAKSGAILTVPQVFYFTTGADFAPYSVSGTILSGTTGVLPEGSIVGLANVNIMKDEGKDGPPPFSGWANVNSNGTYTIPNVSNGKYWLIAAKDVNHDGRLNPDNGIDVIALVSDSIVINNASITNLNLTFVNFTPKIFSESIATADSLEKNLPADRVLKRISGWEVDTLGRARSWEYAYTFTGNSTGQAIDVQSAGSKTYVLDPNYVSWLTQLKQITGYKTAASSATVIANAENAGGKAFRLLPRPDSLELRIELAIADQSMGWFGNLNFDRTKIYWAAAYMHTYQKSQNESQWLKGIFFLCELGTGAIVQTLTLDVNKEIVMPEQFLLSQNFPNPFNPTTNIRFTIPSSNFTSLKIFDLLGKEVAVLVNENKDAGEYTVPFNAAQLPSGIYFYQLRSGNFVEAKKMVLMK